MPDQHAAVEKPHITPANYKNIVGNDPDGVVVFANAQTDSLGHWQAYPEFYTFPGNPSGLMEYLKNMGYIVRLESSNTLPLPAVEEAVSHTRLLRLTWAGQGGQPYYDGMYMIWVEAPDQNEEASA